MRILVGYASQHGSTLGIAERITAGLRGHGHHVVLTALDRDAGPEGFDAAVLGSAIHNGKWLPPAVHFVERNVQALGTLRLWTFSVSLLGEQGSAFRPWVAARLRAPRARRGSAGPAAVRSAVTPRDHHDFAGAVEPDHWPALGRLVFRLMGGRFGDHRDWHDVDRWTESVARERATAPLAGSGPRSDDGGTGHSRPVGHRAPTGPARRTAPERTEPDMTESTAPRPVRTKRWNLRLDLFEEGDVTKVHAVLDTGDNTLESRTTAHRNPDDDPVPEIGDEYAAGRALLDLGNQLLRAGRSDSLANDDTPPRS
ncbi:dsRBD fold-containing protein [Streptomyces sp. BE303]|uniref:dsRBD fold-containing protein n=1 Tax=Streptomyces sp. BE303 TaxID=3002528 RepID=UPI002E77E348|nr:dsRBD fold-containing protein [Streptomyces sp. BE303]